ncbi:glycoside hydrolase family 15 protein [Parvularcula marina]|uniref:Glycoside hydrolase family 15 protein n=1 Tax=Parvularcula marina TaxID=2292771 RepID=A0A371R8E2_9PROT|nr:glycoside hydrolase family 15 protein [Parvularcula marina]RFB01723.1 glycoside hydrolase family 15 protein [Parvularcula marina]
MNLELGAIGNCTVSALIDEDGTCVWLCLPRIDAEPVFNSLLGGKGVFGIRLNSHIRSEQRYDGNTAILETILHSEDGSAVKITDFAPRFTDRGRLFRPSSIVRMIEPLKGLPRITIDLCGTKERGAQIIEPRRGVSHISYPDDGAGFRVTTDVPVSYIMDGREFVLDRPFGFIVGPDESLSDSVGDMAQDWLKRTRDHWRDWSRRLAIPAEWQQAVIRAAITLKLCVYEETGGIVAALTTSIPEHSGSERNWDYRFCWLRDAYFTVTALNRLSAVGTLEHYLSYLRNIVVHTDGGHIQPVYGVSLEDDLTETIATALPGYRGMGPVRFGNQAAEHIQHDVYGHVVLGAAQTFFDDRLFYKSGPLEFAHFEKVGERAYQVYNTPDAGIWEYRGRASVHTSSAIMCWAACERLARIAGVLGQTARQDHWQARADEMRGVILKEAWNEKRNAFTGAFGGDALDASVLLMAEIGFIEPMDPRYVATVERIDDELREGPHVYRYREADDFGKPKTAFTACTFWHIDALARIGRTDQAREMFESVLAHRTRLGLLSEDVDTESGELWGNLPQTYSMVGIINAAARLSLPWEEVV